jgi:hypothetical protein
MLDILNYGLNSIHGQWIKLWIIDRYSIWQIS